MNNVQWMILEHQADKLEQVEEDLVALLRAPRPRPARSLRSALAAVRLAREAMTNARAQRRRQR